jgi:DNA polymerase-3 subunit gamma/tau
MSYLVFARKYRPQTFDQVVGQKPVVKTLQNSLKRDRVAHALLFSGVRGVGKTTLARLMAKSLNCQDGPTPVPCNECRSCSEISSGSALDLLEIDGASNRGIQEVRELKDKIKFMPTSSRYKIIIIDEVHMLTNEAFNALLKTLEEPPAHVYFMFATTELHKIPVTILSRCQRFELRRVSSGELSTHFSALAEMEGVELSRTALSMIVREADGSVRDGLSLLDQVLSYGETPIDENDVVEVLGLVRREVTLGIAEALLTGDRSSALTRLSDAFDFGMDVKRFITDLLECFRTLLLIKIGNCEQLLQQSEEDNEQLRNLALAHPLEAIHHKLNLLMQTADDLRFSFQPRLTLETSFLSIISAGQVIGVETLLEKLDTVLGSLPERPGAQEPDPSPTAHSKAAAEEKKSEAVSIEEAHAALPPKPTFTLEPVDQDKEEAESRSEEELPPRRDVRRDWLEFIAFLKEEKEWMAQSLQQTISVKEDNKELLLEFDDPNDCFVLRSRENRQILTEYVLDFFQQDLSVRIISPENGNGTGAQNSEEPKRRRQQLANHQVVRLVEEIFNGRVGDIRISEPNK